MRPSVSRLLWLFFRLPLFAGLLFLRRLGRPVPTDCDGDERDGQSHNADCCRYVLHVIASLVVDDGNRVRAETSFVNERHVHQRAAESAHVWLCAIITFCYGIVGGLLDEISLACDHGPNAVRLGARYGN